MTTVEHAERIRLAAGDEIDRSRSMLESVGLSWSMPQLVVSVQDPSKFTAELKVEFYQGEDLVDIFEFFVCDGGVLTTSEDEVRRWIQDNVPDVVSRRRQA